MRLNLRDYTAKAKPLLAAAVDMLFPAQCAVCHEAVGMHGALCATCWGQIHFITDPMCFKCGLPFEYRIGEKALCASCMAVMPAYTEARAIFRYDENSKGQVLAFKYHDKTQLAPIFGEWLARTYKPYTDKVQFIVPVPLHYWRLLSRRYNQATLLAHTLGRHTGLPVLPDTLKRIRATESQAGLSRRQRIDNMRGAFTVAKPRRELLKGKSVLLVDDVMTTGATLDACARTLHDAGVQDVYVLTIARTVLAD
jgi:ComF family protein